MKTKCNIAKHTVRVNIKTYKNERVGPRACRKGQRIGR